MTRPFLEDPALTESVLARIKLGRRGAVEDVMGACVYLAGTGTSLPVDCGWTAD